MLLPLNRHRILLLLLLFFLVVSRSLPLRLPCFLVDIILRSGGGTILFLPVRCGEANGGFYGKS
jgi:hypothetical protein